MVPCRPRVASSGIRSDHCHRLRAFREDGACDPVAGRPKAAMNLPDRMHTVKEAHATACGGGADLQAFHAPAIDGRRFAADAGRMPAPQGGALIILFDFGFASRGGFVYFIAHWAVFGPIRRWWFCPNGPDGAGCARLSLARSRGGSRAITASSTRVNFETECGSRTRACASGRIAGRSSGKGAWP